MISLDQRKGKKGSIFKAHKYHRLAAARFRNLDYSEKRGYIRGIVKDILHDPGRGAPLVRISFRNPYKYGTRKEYFVACEGLYSG